jgi:hypothetical protein
MKDEVDGPHGRFGGLVSNPDRPFFFVYAWTKISRLSSRRFVLTAPLAFPYREWQGVDMNRDDESELAKVMRAVSRKFACAGLVTVVLALAFLVLLGAMLVFFTCPGCPW